MMLGNTSLQLFISDHCVLLRSYCENAHSILLDRGIPEFLPCLKVFVTAEAWLCGLLVYTMVKGLWQHFRGLYRHGLGVALWTRDDSYVLDAFRNDYTAEATKIEGRHIKLN